MTQSKTLATFKIDPVVWDGFKMWATTHGTNAAEVLRHLIGECVGGRLPAPTKGGEAQQQAIAGIAERIDVRIEEQIASMEFRLDERTSERLELLWAELAEVRAQVEALQKMPLSELPVAGEKAEGNTREQICLPIDGLPESEAIAAPSVQPADALPRRRKSDRSGNGVSDSFARSRAKSMGWTKGCGESVEQFLAKSGWTREGIRNDARWFPPID
jgi:hypothetical protein